MTASSEEINLDLYNNSYLNDLPKAEQEAIRQSNVDRAQKGVAVWNAWAKNVLAELEKTYPENASEEQKLEIRNQYTIDFRSYEFDENINFSYFIFPLSIDFREAQFSGDADFYKAQFSGSAKFTDAQFSGDAIFWEAQFSGDARFYKAPFSGDAIFWEAQFSGDAIFWEAQFSGDAFFTGAQFSGGTFFTKANFLGNTIFLGAQFKQQSLFINLKFNDKSHAPPTDFRQTDFNRPPLVTDFPSELSQFITANKNRERDRGFYKDCEDKFRELKKLAEGNNNHQKSLEFYACELYCQRRTTGGLRNPKNWVSYLYGLFSGYGLSLWRPTILWFVVMLLGFVSQAVLDEKTSISFSPAAIERAAFYISPSIPPFVNTPLYQKEVRHRLYPNKDKQYQGQLPMRNRLIRFMQTLVTFVSLFFIGLALRNRFKIG